MGIFIKCFIDGKSHGIVADRFRYELQISWLCKLGPGILILTLWAFVFFLKIVYDICLIVYLPHWLVRMKQNYYVKHLTQCLLPFFITEVPELVSGQVAIKSWAFWHSDFHSWYLVYFYCLVGNLVSGKRLCRVMFSLWNSVKDFP